MKPFTIIYTKPNSSDYQFRNWTAHSSAHAEFDFSEQFLYYEIIEVNEGHDNHSMEEA